ncbi:CARDB domain-containing protein [Posidoniimonas polymericola]|nr:CARDB domain-containing protein [Posidoniimonas polymericola]
MKRFRPLAKVLLATGVLGGGGYGAYTVMDPAADQAEPQVEAATLDAAAEAWAQDAPQAPRSEPMALANGTPLGLPPAPLPPQEDMPAPYAPVASDRYAVATPPLPLLNGSVDEEPIARGQNPSLDDLDDEPFASAPNALPEGNPLRPARGSDENGSAPARDAFADSGDDAIGPPPAAVAAFGAGPVDSQVTQVAAAEPLEELPLDEIPPAPLGLPMADQAPLPEPSFDALPVADEPMAPLPMADHQPPASFPPSPAPHNNFDSLPAEPNPLRQSAEPAAPVASEPEQRSVLAEPARVAAAQPFSVPMADAPPARMMVEEPRAMLPSADASGGGVAAVGSGRPGEHALEGQQQPSLAIQKFAPAEIQVGKPCKFLIKVRNVGQRPALNVVVHDQAPAGVQLTATNPPAQANGDELRWELGQMSPGEEKTLSMELTPVEEGPIGSVATVSFAAEASVQTNCTRPQLAIRMTAPSSVLVGQEQQIQIEIKNPGTGDATGVMILENVPENLRHSAGPTLEFEVGTLRAGETRRLQLNMVAETPGKVVNVLTAQADGNLQVDQQVEFEVVAPGLEVAVDGPSKRYLERPATYTVKIGNPGTAPAHNLRLVTQLPRGMKFVKANNMGEYDPASHAVVWSLAELPSGESGAVELTAVPVVAGEQKLQVRGEAQEGLRDETSHATQVEGIAALKFTVLDLEDPIEVGGETEYEIRVANQGTKAATNVQVRAAAPAGMRILSAAGDARHRIQAGSVQFEPIRQLPPQTEMTFKVRVQGAQPGDHRLVVEVGSDDLAQPVRKEESTRVFGDE